MALVSVLVTVPKEETGIMAPPATMRSGWRDVPAPLLAGVVFSSSACAWPAAPGCTAPWVIWAAWTWTCGSVVVAAVEVVAMVVAAVAVLGVVVERIWSTGAGVAGDASGDEVAEVAGVERGFGWTGEADGVRGSER